MSRALVVIAWLVLAAPAFSQLQYGPWIGEGDSLAGFALADAGDVDGDGASEFLIGEPRGYFPFRGKVRLLHGRTHESIREHYGVDSFDDFGIALSGAGDLDGDGAADYVVGDPGYDPPIGASNAGRVVAYSGRTGAPLWQTDGNSFLFELGSGLAALDDMDGDGWQEILAASWKSSTCWVIDSNGNKLLVISGTGSSGFGFAVSRIGDVDLDGMRDFAIGAPYHSKSPYTRNGRISVRSGRTGALLYDVFGTDDDERLGWSLAAMTDVNQDGWPDFVAGADGASSNGTDCGAVRLLSGKDGALLGEIAGSRGNDRMGAAVASMGDWDRDGISDFAAGAPKAGSLSNGEVQVFSGATMTRIWGVEGVIGPPCTSRNYTGPGWFNVELGHTLASGDFDGNDVPDLLIGDPFFECFADESGSQGAFFPPRYQPWWDLYPVGSSSLVLGHPAYWEHYGTGWPGTFYEPTLTPLVDPVFGETLDVQLTNSSPASTTAIVFVGFSATDLPTGSGGRLYVVPFATVPVPLPPSGTTLSAELPGILTDVYVQALVLDPGASDGVAFTSGLQLRIGYDL